MNKEVQYPPTCEGCEHCIYLDSGDFLCEIRECLCIENWIPEMYPIGCEDFKEEDEYE